MDKNNLWAKTPLIRSGHMSARLGCDVYLKLDVGLSTTAHPGTGLIGNFAESAASPLIQVSRRVTLHPRMRGSPRTERPLHHRFESVS